MESPTEVITSTSVDILVERLKTHPEEFFNKDCVVSRDGEKIFAHTKWRRIVTLLMADAPEGSSDNLWLNLFKPDEVGRFRAAMYAAMRAEIDTAIVRVLVGEAPDILNPDAEEARLAMQAININNASARYKFYASQNMYPVGAAVVGGLSGVGMGMQNVPNLAAVGSAATFGPPGAGGLTTSTKATILTPPPAPPTAAEKLFATAKGWLK